MSERMDERNGLGTPEQTAEISSDALVAILQIKRSVKVVYERIATLTAERDALSLVLRQGAESDEDLRTRYTALEKERDDLKARVEQAEQFAAATDAGKWERMKVAERKEDEALVQAKQHKLETAIALEVLTRIATPQQIHEATSAIIAARTAPAKETK